MPIPSAARAAATVTVVFDPVLAGRMAIPLVMATALLRTKAMEKLQAAKP
jgi:hypothetical protein